MIYTEVNINDISNDEYEKWYSLMNDEKKLRIDKFRFDDDKKRSIAGEMLAKKTIGKYIGVAPESINISINRYSKPYIPQYTNVEFNISHCEDMVVCAIHPAPIGIDVEKIVRMPARVAKKHFTNHEKKFIFGKTPTDEDYLKDFDDAQLKRFFQMWTAKEAYIKYNGFGMCYELIDLNYDKKRFKQLIKGDYVITIYY